MSDGARMPGVPEARTDPVLRRYPLRRVRLPVGQGQLSLVVPDERAWMREGTWAPSVVRGKEPPYWIRIWPAALATARAVQRVADLGQASVLDLGCGLGIPGVQAAAAGAKVTFADLEPDALAFACWNGRIQPGRRCDPTGVAVDWAQGVVPGSFDLLLLSDVSYHHKHHAPLRRHLEHALAADGAALHADPHRDLASRFLQQLPEPFVTTSWTRPTLCQDRRADVRLTLISRGRSLLDRWGARFAVPSDQGPAAGA